VEFENFGIGLLFPESVFLMLKVSFFDYLINLMRAECRTKYGAFAGKTI